MSKPAQAGTLLTNRQPTQEDDVQIERSAALVTGANRGLGRCFAEALLRRGASVYAAKRGPALVDLPGVTPIQLDITDPESVAAAAAATGDVSLLINNAGSSTGASLLEGSLDDIRLEMDTHFFGTLAVTRAFAPQLAAQGGGAILNVLSALSWFSAPGIGAYCAAKSAEWSLTNSIRQELAEQGTQVSGLHVGYMDTDMTRHVSAPKSDPAVVAELALEELEAGHAEILADERSRKLRAGLSGGVASLYPQFA
jgi:NAD(P)-dependent dehydrogenase (short-subunit alcohol dehydrogenase family)